MAFSDWTAKINDFGRNDDGSLYANVTFVSSAGAPKVIKSYNVDNTLTLNSFKQLLIADILIADASSNLKALLSKGPFDLTLDVVPPPTAAQVAATQFFADLAVLRAMNAMVVLGLADASIAPATQLALVQSEYLAAYLTDPRMTF